MVGGSALVACIAIIMGHSLALLASMVAGVIMIGYIVVEILIFKQVPPGPTLTEYLYIGLGLLAFLLAGYIWVAERVLA